MTTVRSMLQVRTNHDGVIPRRSFLRRVALGGMGPGFLGARSAPFNVPVPTRMPDNVTLPPRINASRFERRLDLVKDLSEELVQSGGKPLVEEHQELYNRATRLVLSKDLKAFDLTRE